MAIGAAIFSTMMSVSAAKKQRRAGRMAQTAAEEGARGIEAETEMNIGQTRRAQAQTMGLAKANVAASGVRFDASKIAAVKFTEQETEASKQEWIEIQEEKTQAYRAERDVYHDDDDYEKRLGRANRRVAEFEAETEVVQSGGGKKGDSIFTYLTEMKRTFAEDIAYKGKEGKSRAKVARMGGQVARAQAQAGAIASIGSAVGSFASAYGGK